MDRTAYFSNFKYRNDNTLKCDSVPAIEIGPAMITVWQISPPFKSSQVESEKHPDERNLANLNWQQVDCAPTGLVDISHGYGRTGREPDCILLKTMIHSDPDNAMRLDFGDSDYVAFFLNKKLLFLFKT